MQLFSVLTGTKLLRTTKQDIIDSLFLSDGLTLPPVNEPHC